MMRCHASLALASALSVMLGCAAPKAAQPRESTTLASVTEQGLQRTVLPPLVLARLHEQPIALDEYLRGRVAVIDLWASWCEACKRTSAQVERLAHQFRSTDLLVIGINLGEDRDTVEDFLTGHPPLPTFLDVDFAFANALNARELPAVFIVDRTGAVVRRASALDAAGLDVIRDLLEEG